MDQLYSMMLRVIVLGNILGNMIEKTFIVFVILFVICVKFFIVE